MVRYLHSKPYIGTIFPKTGQIEVTIPQRGPHTYTWRLPIQLPNLKKDDIEGNRIAVGDEVWVKPPKTRCTDQWNKGFVTEITSQNNVMVDGMPRHILDIRRVEVESSDGEEGDLQVADEEEVERMNNMNDGGEPEVPETPERGQRNRRPPPWLSDYVTDF